jgi:hypothetical protein
VYEGETVRLQLVLPPELASKTGLKVSGECMSPDEKKQSLTFSSTDASNTVWEASFVAQRTGAYRANATAAVEGGQSVEFQTAVCAQGGSPEFENTAPNNALLKDLADSTGGKFGYVGEIGRLVKGIKSTRPPEQREIEWSSASSKLLAGVILTLWAGEWMLRKLKNLA